MDKIHQDPMKLTLRPCNTEDDFWHARNFLREVFPLNDRLEHSWHVARLDYWRWHYIKTCNSIEPIEKGMALWENADGNSLTRLGIHEQSAQPPCWRASAAVARSMCRSR